MNPKLHRPAALPAGTATWIDKCKQCGIRRRVAVAHMFVPEMLDGEGEFCSDCIADLALGCSVMGGETSVRLETGEMRTLEVELAP